MTSRWTTSPELDLKAVWRKPVLYRLENVEKEIAEAKASLVSIDTADLGNLNLQVFVNLMEDWESQEAGQRVLRFEYKGTVDGAVREAIAKLKEKHPGMEPWEFHWTVSADLDTKNKALFLVPREAYRHLIGG